VYIGGVSLAVTALYIELNKEFTSQKDDFVIALRPQTPKHIRGGWSQYTDISEPVDGGVGTVQKVQRK
jgi:hypothetical protein